MPNQKGFAPVAILLMVVAVLAVIGGATYWYKYQKAKSYQPSAQQIPEQTLNLENLSNNNTANWKTYRNNEYGFEFKYPSDWKFQNNTTNETILYQDFSKENNFGALRELSIYTNEKYKSFEELKQEVINESNKEDMGVPINIEYLPEVDGLKFTRRGGDEAIYEARFFKDPIFTIVFSLRVSAGTPTGPSFDDIISTFNFYRKSDPQFLISIISPKDAETWKVGETHEIKWEANNVDKVDIGFRREGSGAEANGWIAKGISAAQSSISWKILGTSDIFNGPEYQKANIEILIGKSPYNPETATLGIIEARSSAITIER